MITRIDLAVIWLIAISFFIAGVWTLFISEPYPIPGYVYLAKEDGFSIIMQTSAVVGPAIWLSTPKWHTKERFLIFWAFAATQCIQGFLFIDFVFSSSFLVF